MQKFILDNKLELCYYPIPNSYSVTIGLYINGGLLDESDNLNGITHLLEHMHFRHLGNMSQEELYVQMDKIGGNIKATTYKELLKFSIKVRPCYARKALELLSKIIMMYDWTEDDIISEKKVVINELCSKESYTDTERIVDSLCWRNCALSKSILGNEYTVSNITLEDLINYKKNIFTKGNVSVVITGSITQEFIESCNTLFSTVMLNDKKNIHPKENLSFLCNRKPDISLIHQSWEYVDVDLIFDVTPRNDISSLIILNSILGGGTGSKLQKLLREKLGLTYDISSYIKSYSQGCFLNISLSTYKNDVYDCIQNICFVLNEVKKEITDVDMDTNIPYYTENLWYILEDTEEINTELGWDLVMKKTPMTVEEKIKLFSKVDKCVLSELSKEIFVPSNMCVSVVGNVSRITKKKIKEIINNLLA